VIEPSTPARWTVGVRRQDKRRC